jgi:integrase
MLKGPYLYPTTSDRFFQENQATIRSAKSRDTWAGTYRQVQAMYPLKRVEAFTEEDLVKFLQNGNWSSNTIAKHRTALRQLFSWATRVGLCRKDPAVWLHKLVRVPKQAVREHHWLSAFEVRSVLATCKHDLIGKRDRVALSLGFYAGLRASEIASLTWAQVRSNHLLITGKGNKLAPTPLVPQLETMLRAWEFDFINGLSGILPLSQPVVIPFKCFGGGCLPTPREEIPLWGRGVDPTTIRRLTHLHGSEAGMPGLAPHDLRRSFANMLEEKHVPLPDISRALRHENVATTSTYLSKNPSRMLESVNALRFG